MATLDDDAVIHELVVVAFDMCSSSTIIEDLTRTNSLRQYDRLLRSLRAWLSNREEEFGYILYKFAGDGWILLFLPDATGESLMKFILQLSEKYESLRRAYIDDHLESALGNRGLTFGIDVGFVPKLVLGGEVEFVGRPINVACRLQNAVKDKGLSPDYRCLISRKVFNTYLKKLNQYQFSPVKRDLRNITGGEKYQCYKVNFSPLMK